MTDKFQGLPENTAKLVSSNDIRIGLVMGQGLIALSQMIYFSGLTGFEIVKLTNQKLKKQIEGLSDEHIGSINLVVAGLVRGRTS